MATSMLIKAFLFAAGISLALAQDCNVDADVGFIMDSSGSITKFYDKEKAFLNTLAASFGIGSGKSRASVVTFSSDAELTIRFNDFDNLQDFQDAVMKIPLMGYMTAMDKALRIAQRQMFTAANGARAGKAKLLIMLTDGEQTAGIEDPALVVPELRQSGINVLVIGMGKFISKKTLIRIAGGKQYVYLQKKFGKLASPVFLGNVKATACDAAEESLSLPTKAPPATTPAATTPAATTPDDCPAIDTDYNGKDIKLDLNCASWTECSDKCKANAECKFFTFVQESGCCYHKSGKGGATVTPGLISGSRDCPILAVQPTKYKCYQWSPQDKVAITKITGKWSVQSEKKHCEDILGYKFSEGRDALAPGCGSCWCCKPTAR